MHYHDILHDDLRNGSGIRVTIFLSGCDHKCNGCHNPETWNPESGIEFDADAMAEIVHYLKQEYCQGITFSGGDPLYLGNRGEVTALLRNLGPVLREDQDVWMYTGYSWEEVNELPVMEYVDVLVDGEFIEGLADVNYPWCGSTNQRVIRVQESKKEGRIVLYDD